jgi:hypothetical protein
MFGDFPAMVTCENVNATLAALPFFFDFVGTLLGDIVIQGNPWGQAVHCDVPDIFGL